MVEPLGLHRPACRKPRGGALRRLGEGLCSPMRCGWRAALGGEGACPPSTVVARSAIADRRARQGGDGRAVEE